MNLTGLGPNAYSVNREVAEGERSERLYPKRSVSDTPKDNLGVIEISSTYLETTDRWYAGKGFMAIFGLAFIAIGSVFIPMIIGVAQGKPVLTLGDWGFILFALATLLGFAALGVYLMRYDAFRLTHYPIRYNRKSRMVYAFRPDGTVIEAPWDSLFFFRGHAHVPMFGDTWDIRAHVLADDGKTVVDTFTLAYSEYGKKHSPLFTWEYIRRYMEAPDGVRQCYDHTIFCNPVKGRREGLYYGIVRGFLLSSGWPVLQALLSPVTAPLTLGRLIAMCTNRVPQWPAHIEAACTVEPDDPYRKDWRNNGRLPFMWGAYSVLMFLIGNGVAAILLYHILSSIFAGK